MESQETTQPSKKPIELFWDWLNEFNPMSASCLAFNVHCFEKSEALGLTERQMNACISAWGTTLDKTIPEHLLKL